MKTSFVIDRSKWRCGDVEGLPSARGRGETLMRNHEGFMCCLGQIRAQQGKPNKPISVPLYLVQDYQEKPDEVLVTGQQYDLRHTEFASRAMPINDNSFLTDTQRERQLERLAEQYGLRIEFTGEYVYP